MAGIFYPAENRPLIDWVDQFIKRNDKAEQAVAAVVPHGGDTVSGEILGRVFSQIRWPSRAVILGPNHSGPGERFSVAAKGDWATPLGNVFIDQELAQAILGASPEFSSDAQAHTEEHAVEVLLPFLQRVQKGIRIVPLALGEADSAQAQRMGLAIAQAIQAAGGDAMVLISTDLSRYEPDERVRAQDERLMEHLLALDGPGLLEAASETKASMCGTVAAAVGLSAARHLGASQGHLTAYRTSAEATGEAGAVVGYAGIVIK